MRGLGILRGGMGRKRVEIRLGGTPTFFALWFGELWGAFVRAASAARYHGKNWQFDYEDKAWLLDRENRFGMGQILYGIGIERRVVQQMVELVTKCGWRFMAASSVKIGDREFDMEQLDEPQRRYVAGKLSEQGLNAAFTGRALFTAEGIPSFEDAFGEK